MSESNNKEGVKVPWFFIGTILFAILLSLLFLNPDTSNSSTEVSEKESLSYSDTLLVGNDSLRTDMLRRDYGFYIVKNKLDLSLFSYHNTGCTYTIGYWCYNSNLKGTSIWLSYKCYTEEGTIICKGESRNEIGAGDGESEILNFSVWLTELVKYKGIVTIVPYIRIGGRTREYPLPKIEVKFGGMFSFPKVLSEKTE